MIAEVHALASIPEALTAVDAAPLLWAGVTTYNGLVITLCSLAISWRGRCLRDRTSCIQFARRLGFRMIAIAPGPEKEKLATELGAQSYIDSQAEDAAMTLQSLDGARVILATAPSGRSIGPLLPGLAARGRMIVVGASSEPIEVNPGQLIFDARSIEGGLSDTAMDSEDALSYSVLENIRPMICRRKSLTQGG